ncbi:MAG: ParB N-terminal domain-containing protein [Patescibacteria group bacterium]|nr:ParB N-terminal domain-containing protein [Patescibacteria group bacterium]
MRKIEELHSFPFWKIVQLERNYQKIKASVKKEGIKDPIIVTNSGLILDGHHRWRIAIELGLREIPCKVPKNFAEIFKIILGAGKDIARMIAKLIF